MTLLPPLAFGNHVNLDSAEDLTDVLVAHDPARSIHMPDAPRDFKGYMGMAQVGDLAFGAFAHTSVTVEAGEAPGDVVMIPVFGSITIGLKKSRFTAHAGHSLAFLTGGGNTVETTLDSHVAVSFDRIRLLQTAKTMLGLDEESPIDLNLEQMREVSVNPMGLPMATVLGNLFRTIDALSGANLSLLNLDDLFYRSLAVMLNSQVAQAFANPAVERRSIPVRREIRAVCDYVQAHLTETIRLTDLERVSGLSARNLQLVFQRQFQCSPMQWVRRERFALSRRLLLVATPGDSVTTIALNCGFTQLGAFSQGYFALFGETPSETLRQGLRRN